MRESGQGYIVLGRVLALGEKLRLLDNEGLSTVYELIRVDNRTKEAVLWVVPPGEEVRVGVDSCGRGWNPYPDH